MHEVVSRRNFLRGVTLGGAGLAGAVLLGCSPEVKPTTETSISIVTPTPTILNRTVDATKPTEIPLTPEQQAVQTALESWTRLWSSSQMGTRNLFKDSAFFKSTISNFSPDQIITQKGNLPSPIDVSWAGGYLHGGATEAQLNAFKYAGEGQIDKLKFQTTGGVSTSDADKANGIEWSGQVEIDYIMRYHANHYTPQDWINDRQALENWLVKPDTQFPQYSDWQPDKYIISVQKSKGKWSTGPISQFSPSGFTQDGITFPSKFVAYEGYSIFVCSSAGNGPCKEIKYSTPK